MIGGDGTALLSGSEECGGVLWWSDPGMEEWGLYVHVSHHQSYPSNFISYVASV